LCFIEDFISYLTTPNLNNDPYTEVYIRAWFKNFSEGVPPEACAQEQRDVWSIASNGGIIRPLVLALSSKSTFQASDLKPFFKKVIKFQTLHLKRILL